MLKINKIKVPFHKWYSHKLWLIHDVAKAFNSHPIHIYDNHGLKRIVYKNSVDSIMAHSRVKYDTVKPLLSATKTYLKYQLMLYELLGRFCGKSSPVKFYKILITTTQDSFIHGKRVVNANGTTNTYNDVNSALKHVKKYLKQSSHGMNNTLVSNVETVLEAKNYVIHIPYLHIHSHMLAVGTSISEDRLQSLLDKHYPNEFKITVEPFTVNPSVSPQLVLGDYSVSKTVELLTPFIKYMYKDCNHQLNEVNNLSTWKKVNSKHRHHVYRVIYSNDNHIQLHNHFRAKSAIKKTVNQINILVTLINLAKIRFYLNKYQVTSQSNLFDPTKYNRPVYSNLYTNIPNHCFKKSYHQINLFKPVKYCSKSITSGQSLTKQHTQARMIAGSIRHSSDEIILSINGSQYLIKVSPFKIKSLKIQSNYIFDTS